MRKLLSVILSAVMLLLTAMPVFAAETAEILIYGDVDGNGNITVSDVTVLQKYLAGIDVREKFVLSAADTDVDGSVTISDVTCIQRYIALYTSNTGRTGEIITEATKHRLVKRAKKYELNYATNELELTETVNLEYKNAYPTLIKSVYEDEEFEPSETVFDYTFENDLPKSCVFTNANNQLTTNIEYNKGRVYDVNQTHVSGSKYHVMYQYSDDSAYFTSLVREAYAPATEFSPEAFEEETDSIQISVENGLMKKSVNSGYYANWDANNPKVWRRFNGTYTAEYDNDGILKTMSAEFRTGPSGVQKKFETKKENGFITEIIVKGISGKTNDFIAEKKIEFEYTDTEISAARYSQMMNYFAVGEGSNYYNNNWY